MKYEYKVGLNELDQELEKWDKKAGETIRSTPSTNNILNLIIELINDKKDIMRKDTYFFLTSFITNQQDYIMTEWGEYLEKNPFPTV
jgi:hypothetical protein